MDKFRLLGFVGGIPLSVEIGGKDVLILYFLLFIPLSLSIIFRRSFANAKLTLIDKTSAAYFLWALVGLGIFLLQAVFFDGDSTAARVASAFGTMVYAVLPFIFGRLVFQSDQETQSLFEGLIAGMILSCGVILSAYAIKWPIDMFSARYEIGQRIPMVIGFFTILSLSRNQPLLKLFLIVFLSVSLIALSETRVSIAAFMISLLMAMLAFGRIYGRNKVLVVIMGMLLAMTLASQISVGLRFRTISLISAVEVWMGNKEQHLADASADMRVQIWKNLLGKLTDSPINFILGYGQLGPSFIGDPLKYESGYVVQQYSAHNDYLDVFVRTGVIGLILYLTVFYSVIICAWKCRGNAPGSVEFMYYHLVFALFGVVIYGMFHETTRYPWFGVLFWLFAGILSTKSAKRLNIAQGGVKTN